MQYPTLLYPDFSTNLTKNQNKIKLKICCQKFNHVIGSVTIDVKCRI